MQSAFQARKDRSDEGSYADGKGNVWMTGETEKTASSKQPEYNVQN